jgi:thioredoxin-related protein
MKIFSAFILSLVLLSGWETDMEDAKKKADKEHKMVLLSFSGSDWCIPCIKMHKEIFEAPVFTEYAENNLVLVNADFPRLAKHQLSKDAVKKNEKLADRYNKEGIFPLTLLLDAEGKVVKTWEGYPRVNAEQFTSQIKDLLDAGKNKE